MRPARFLECFENSYILLIVNMLHFVQNFRIFITCKKTAQMLNFHFRQKYHFVILKIGILACFYSLLWGCIQQTPLSGTYTYEESVESIYIYGIESHHAEGQKI